MATVINTNGKTRAVKNLGWLVRHQHQVSIIEVSPQSHFQNPRKGFESRMIATMQNGVRYITDWASTAVCREWTAARRGMKAGVTSLCGDHAACFDSQ